MLLFIILRICLDWEGNNVFVCKSDAGVLEQNLLSVDLENFSSTNDIMNYNC